MPVKKAVSVFCITTVTSRATVLRNKLLRSLLQVLRMNIKSYSLILETCNQEILKICVLKRIISNEK